MLKRVLKLLAFASVAVGMARAAENPFIGAWKLNSSLSRMPDETKVESKGGNTYSFDFGGGVGESIVTDGTDQPGRGGTTLSVKADAPTPGLSSARKMAGCCSERPGNSRRTAVRSRTTTASSNPMGPRPAWITCTSAMVEDRASRPTGRVLGKR